MKHKVIVLTGPTASGKTALANSLAKELNSEIISADSRQCFTEFGVAVAKPSIEERKEIPYHFIDCFSFLEHSTAQDFADIADLAVAKLHSQNKIPIICGGTGLYIKAWMQGLDTLPQITPKTREQAQDILHAYGIMGLQDFLRRRKDPFMQGNETQNTARLLRAVEVQIQSSISITEKQTGQNRTHDYQILEFALDPRAVQNYADINKRVELMFASGLWDEAMLFYPYREHKNLKTVGYQEIYQCIDEGQGPKEALKLIQQKTRNYAKRQKTWYRNQGAYRLLKPENAAEQILAALR